MGEKFLSSYSNNWVFFLSHNEIRNIYHVSNTCSLFFRKLTNRKNSVNGFDNRIILMLCISLFRINIQSLIVSVCMYVRHIGMHT